MLQNQLINETGYGNTDEHKSYNNYYLGIFVIIISIILIYML